MKSKKIVRQIKNITNSVNELAVSLQQGCESICDFTKACDKIMPIDSITQLHSSAN